jgi:hypothetical protein
MGPIVTAPWPSNHTRGRFENSDPGFDRIGNFAIHGNPPFTCEILQKPKHLL